MTTDITDKEHISISSADNVVSSCIASTTTSSISDDKPTDHMFLDVAEYSKRRTSLTDTDRLSVLNRQFLTLGDDSLFPRKDGRQYHRKWESTYPWLCYSISEDGAYCSYCICFDKAASRDEFVSLPFTDWKNACGQKRGALDNHCKNSERHKASAERAEEFLSVTFKEKRSINECLSKAYEETVQRNTRALLSILDVILALGKRGIALRGSWDEKQKKEDGNFHFFIDWRSKVDDDLKSHLETAKRNARYLSPQIQNEMISAIEDVVRSNIVSKVNKSKFFSVMADETTDAATKEQVAICLRYLEQTDNRLVLVNEDFVGFVEVDVANAEKIASVLVKSMTKWGLDCTKLRGQGYDGASVMMGQISGVQARVKETFPKAKYLTHCTNHRLNLVIIASCTSVADICNFMNILQKLCFFLRW